MTSFIQNELLRHVLIWDRHRILLPMLAGFLPKRSWNYMSQACLLPQNWRHEKCPFLAKKYFSYLFPIANTFFNEVIKTLNWISCFFHRKIFGTNNGKSFHFLWHFLWKGGYQNVPRKKPGTSLKNLRISQSLKWNPKETQPQYL